ncbi:MAG: hypothetical protein ACR2J9_13275 [Gaiellales bacterium]
MIAVAPLEWDAVPRRVSRLRQLAVAAVLLGALLIAVPSASAANCGKQLINEYFFSGHLKYHTQDCYASALKQVDPDARMYSGIMGAIRAARARDKAADEKANAPDPAPVDTTPIDTVPTTPIDTLPVTTAPMPTETVEPTITAEARTGAIQTQAAVDTSSSQPGVPLPVIVLGGLAALLMLVGLGGLAVRYLDRGY